MRRVDAPAAFAEALAGARREARASFGDDAVLIERYVAAPRHVEVQVFGDAHGHVVHLYERECSLQRRHQKVIEEAPAPGIPAATREAMTAAAVRAARAVDYVGAGTVEFIADGREGLRPDGFWFMEMNTRLQVEHPVTEAVTGLDLVEWQLRVAMGEPLPCAQDEIGLVGHAIEARLYAEDAAAGFLPATGRLSRLAFGVVRDGDPEGGTGGVRVDTGVREGDVVSPHYDPMLAKLVAHGSDRGLALARLERLIGETVVLGTVTNLEFLLALCRHPDVRAARLDTDLIGRELDALLGKGAAGREGGDADELDEEARAARALVAVVRAAARPRERRVVGGGEPLPPPAESPSPARRLGLWTLWGAPTRTVRFDGAPAGGGPDDAAAGDARGGDVSGQASVLEVVRDGADRWTVRDARGALALTLDPDALAGGRACVVVGGRARRAEALVGDGVAELRLGERVHRLSWTVPGAAPAAAASGDVLLAPMPGRVIDVAGASGTAVRAGQTLVTLEAMKMEHALVAPRDGVVAAFGAVVGTQVAQGDELVRLEPATPPAAG